MLFLKADLCNGDKLSLFQRRQSDFVELGVRPVKPCPSLIEDPRSSQVEYMFTNSHSGLVTLSGCDPSEGSEKPAYYEIEDLLLL